MGTNYYLMSKNKSLVKNYFDDYEIVDEPFLGYQIHIAKTSFGWAPLMQKHSKAFTTFAELRKFYLHNVYALSIYNEYLEEVSWGEFEKKITEWANVAPQACKWVQTNSKYMELVNCEAAEADIFTPFRHDEYGESERKAARKFGLQSFSGHEYTRDPDYKIDWVKGDFA